MNTVYSATTQDLADYNFVTQKWPLDNNTYLNTLKGTLEGREVLKTATCWSP
jgi:hypothetical protein